MTGFAPVLRSTVLLSVALAFIATTAQVGSTAAAPASGPKGRIAVVAGGGLSVISAATGARRELDTGVMSAPAWSPDGRELAYVAGGTFAGREALRATSLGGRQRVITGIPSGISTGPAWSPRGDRLAYTLDWTFDGSSRLLLVDRDGRHRRLVEKDVSAYQVPPWSPDGRQVAYRKDSADGSQSIWVARANGRGRRLVRGRALDYPDSIAWSPDGRRIAFVGEASPAAAGASIMIGNADGTGPRSIASVVSTYDDASVGNVSWSPSGGAIAYVRWTLNEYGDRIASDLCVADPRGSGSRVLARSEIVDELSWSPDGKWLAFLTDEAAPDGSGRSMRIWLVRRDGTGKRPLARVGQEASGLAWQPAA